MCRQWKTILPPCVYTYSHARLATFDRAIRCWLPGGLLFDLIVLSLLAVICSVVGGVNSSSFSIWFLMNGEERKVK